MKLDITASWGYPVLRPGSDDYIESEFQSDLALKMNPETMDVVEVDVSLDFPVPELRQLILDGKAHCVIYVHCRNTWFEEVYALPGLKGIFEIEKSKVEGDTAFWTLIVAKETIPNFTSSKFNEEYSGLKFNFLPNQILGIAEPESQYISRDFFKSVTSLIDYDINDNERHNRWRVNLHLDRITVVANTSQIRSFRTAENTDLGKGVLLNAIFLPVVQYCVATLLNNPDEYENLRWAQVFTAKMQTIKEKRDSLIIAQDLLKDPTGWLNKHLKWDHDET